jgi:hypothetical protein
MIEIAPFNQQSTIFNQQSSMSLARGPLQISPLQFLDVGFHKTLRHTLHAAVGMLLFPLRLCRVKFQQAVLCGTVPALANIAELNAGAAAVFVTHGSSRKPD